MWAFSGGSVSSLSSDRWALSCPLTPAMTLGTYKHLGRLALHPTYWPRQLITSQLKQYQIANVVSMDHLMPVVVCGLPCVWQHSSTPYATAAGFVRIVSVGAVMVIANGNGVVKEDIAARLGVHRTYLPGLRLPSGSITLLVSFHRACRRMLSACLGSALIKTHEDIIM